MVTIPPSKRTPEAVCPRGCRPIRKNHSKNFSRETTKNPGAAQDCCYHRLSCSTPTEKIVFCHRARSAVVVEGIEPSWRVPEGTANCLQRQHDLIVLPLLTGFYEAKLALCPAFISPFWAIIIVTRVRIRRSRVYEVNKHQTVDHYIRLHYVSNTIVTLKCPNMSLASS